MWGQENMVFTFGARLGVEKYGFHGHDSVYGVEICLFLAGAGFAIGNVPFHNRGRVKGVNFHSREGGGVGSGRPAGRPVGPQMDYDLN